MLASDISRLVLLGTIWGGSFVFLRVVAPALGRSPPPICAC